MRVSANLRSEKLMASRWMFARCLFSVERRLLHVADCTLPVQAAGAVSCIDASQALWERLTSGAVSAKRYLLPRDQDIARQPRVDRTTVNQDTVVHGEPRAGPLYEPSPAAGGLHSQNLRVQLLSFWSMRGSRPNRLHRANLPTVVHPHLILGERLNAICVASYTQTGPSNAIRTAANAPPRAKASA